MNATNQNETEEEKQQDKEGRWRMIIGISLIITACISSGWVVIRYHNLAECNKKTVQTLHQRSLYIDDIDELATQADDNISTLIRKIRDSSGQLTREAWTQMLNDFDKESERIKQKRKEIRTKQAKFVYPSLESCL